jgi:DNA polymerase III delta prime subunit
MEFVTSIWSEKYRPKKLDDMSLPEQYRKYFEICISNGEIENMLLYGPPGSGKTAIARIITSPNGILSDPDDNLLFLNGSLKSTRGISYMEEVVDKFLKSPPGGNDKQKVVFIDEADGLTNDAIDSLRGIINDHALYGRFVFTANYTHPISDALMSRFACASFEFKSMPVEEVIKYCEHILKSEKIEFTAKDLKYIANTFYPDVRTTVGILQKNSKTGKLEINRETVINGNKVIVVNAVEYIKAVKSKNNKAVSESLAVIMKTLQEYDVDYRNIYTELFNNKDVPLSCKIIINEYVNTHRSCFIPSQHLAACLFKMGRSITEYDSLIKE